MSGPYQQFLLFGHFLLLGLGPVIELQYIFPLNSPEVNACNSAPELANKKSLGGVFNLF